MLFKAQTQQNQRGSSTDDWTLASKSSNLILYSRPHKGSALKEFKAVGSIEAPTTAMHRMLDDVDSYPSFMPYMAECRIIKRDGDSIITYQRLAPRLVSERDYTLRVEEKSWTSGSGLAYLHRWQTANEAGPPPRKGVLRVSVSEGSWLLEPDGTDKTPRNLFGFQRHGGRFAGLHRQWSRRTRDQKGVRGGAKTGSRPEVPPIEHRRAPTLSR